jgi:hypothetical protein
MLYHYAVCSYAEFHILSIIMLSVIMLNVVMLSVIVLIVVMLSFILLIVVMLGVVMLTVTMLSVVAFLRMVFIGILSGRSEIVRSKKTNKKRKNI